MVPKCHKTVQLYVIRVIDDISEQQQNLLETLWPNVLIFHCRNVRGPARKQNMSKVTMGKWQSWGEDSSPCFWALGLLPLLQGGNGHKGTLTLCPNHTESRRAVHVYKLHNTYRRITVQTSHCRDPSHHSLCTDAPWWVKLDTAHVTGTVTHMASTKHYSLGEMLNGSHCSSTCSSPEIFKCEGEGRAQLHKKGKVMNEQPHTGLGLWVTVWISGAGHD